MDGIQIISPVDGSIYRELRWASVPEIERALQQARAAQLEWNRVSVNERLAICRRFIDILLRNKLAIAGELTWQMGRPIAYAPKEVERAAERCLTMLELSSKGLAPI